MILGDPCDRPRQPHAGRQPRHPRRPVPPRRARRPDALALVDPPNRATLHRRRAAAPHLCAGRPHDRRRSPARLRRMGLPTDAIVGIQLPNTVESVLDLLGVLRAGLIAAPLPLLWRRADAVAALGARRRQGADRLRPGRRRRPLRARHAGRGRRLFRSAMSAASAPICPTASCRSTISSRPRSSIRCRRASANGRAIRPAHLAAITWDVGADGVVPVARSHLRADGRRACRPARKPAGAGCRHPVDAGAVLVRRPLPARCCPGC